MNWGLIITTPKEIECLDFRNRKQSLLLFSPAAPATLIVAHYFAIILCYMDGYLVGQLTGDIVDF